MNASSFHKKIRKQRKRMEDKIDHVAETSVALGKELSQWMAQITFYPGRIAHHVWENEFALT